MRNRTNGRLGGGNFKKTDIKLLKKFNHTIKPRNNS